MGWRNEFDIKNIEIKSVENRGATINLNKEETDKLAKVFLRNFLIGKGRKRIEYIDNALKLRNKKFIENFLSRHIKKMWNLMEIIETSQIIKERAGIDIEEALRERLNERGWNFPLDSIIRTVFKNLQFTKEEQEKIIKKRLEQSGFLFEDLDEVKGEYRDIASDFLNKNVSNILNEIKLNWYYFDKVGRGYDFKTVRRRLICISKHRDLLTAENEKKICDFLLGRKNVEAIIKRRIKKKKHQKYIKALLSFLPDEIQKKYLAYLI